jgi:hypothetical protein
MQDLLEVARGTEAHPCDENAAGGDRAERPEVTLNTHKGIH